MADTKINTSIPSGLITLPDGRIQVTFAKIAMDNILQIPLSIYAITQELTLIDAAITDHGKCALFDLINIAQELYPDTMEMEQALKAFNKKA